MDTKVRQKLRVVVLMALSCLVSSVTYAAQAEDGLLAVWNGATQAICNDDAAALIKVCDCNPGALHLTSGHNNNNLLHIAAQRNAVNCCVALCMRDVHLAQEGNKQGETPAHKAARHGHVDALRVVLRRDVHQVRDREGDTVLHAAVRANSAACCDLVRQRLDSSSLRWLLDAGGRDHRTPLHIAADGRAEALEVLCTIIAPMSGRLMSTYQRRWDKRGRTALRIALEGGHKECVRLLLDGRISLDAPERGPNGDREPIVHYAVGKGSSDAVRLLLQAFERENQFKVVDAPDAEGYTALQRAVQTGDEATMAVLLEYGADVAATLPDGRTVVDLAVEAGNHDHAAALQAALAAQDAAHEYEDDVLSAETTRRAAASPIPVPASERLASWSDDWSDASSYHQSDEDQSNDDQSGVDA